MHVKSLGVTRGWQMPNPQAAQNLSSGTEKAANALEKPGGPGRAGID